MTTAVNEGLFPGNYEDYVNDDVARQREIDLLGDIIPDDSSSTRSNSVQTTKNSGPQKYWVDKCFPADGRSLYFDPFNPPKGSIPSSSLTWNRICLGEVIDCVQPTLYFNNARSSEIDQGALGNAHFVNSLRLLSASTSSNVNGHGYVKRLLVSDIHAKYGIYTFKFFKAGHWRYVHVDDRIPCRQSGKVNYCRNKNPNETFAMLLEKAYAKLHGCYEALVYGTIPKTLIDLTPHAYVKTWKAHHSKPTDVCDVVWDLLEESLQSHKLIGCSRVVKDPYGESLAERKGVTLDYMYQVVDIKVAEAEATETLNALTVGMVAVRNLQIPATGVAGGASAVGRVVGRWNYGHPLWVEYPGIGELLRDASRHIQFRRGLGVAPTEETTDDDFPYEKKGYAGAKGGGGVSAPVSNAEVDDISVASGKQSVGSSVGPGSVNMFESIISDYDPSKSKTLMEFDDNNYDHDDILVQHVSTRGLDAVQPRLPDIMWIQIEDFVAAFNRVHVVTDLSFHSKFSDKTFLSRWIPGDGVVGSGGPPFLFPKVIRPQPVSKLIPSTGKAADRRSNSGEVPADIPQPKHGDIMSEYLDHDRDGKDLDDFVEPPSELPDEDEEEEEGEASKGIVVPDDILDSAEITELEKTLAAHNKSKHVESTLDYSNSAIGMQNAHHGLINNQIGNANANFDDIIGQEPQNVISYSNEGGPMPSTAAGTKRFVGINGIERNEEFLNNPMYAVSVNEPSKFTVTMLQADRRWSVLRLGDTYRDVTSNEFSVRGDRLAACMRYPMAIGFVVIKLSGAHSRVANYRHRKVVAVSDFVEYSNSCSALISLRPGRYAVIPYSHEPLDRTAGYMIHSQFLQGQVEWENEDLVDERPEDNSESEDEPDTDDEDHIKRQKKQPKYQRKLKEKFRKRQEAMEAGEAVGGTSAAAGDDDDDDDDLDEEDEFDPLEDEYEEEDEETAQKRREAIAAAAIDDRAFPPTLLIAEDQNNSLPNNHRCYSSEESWEWVEEDSAESFVSLYEEIGELSKLVLSMRKDVKILNGKMKNR